MGMSFLFTAIIHSSTIHQLCLVVSTIPSHWVHLNQRLPKTKRKARTSALRYRMKLSDESVPASVKAQIS